MLASWESLPDEFRIPAVREYYDELSRQRWKLVVKRIMDLILSVILILILTAPLIVIALVVKFDSRGPVLYRQVRVTQFGKTFRITKFRTMHHGMGGAGIPLTSQNDTRVTRVGVILRKYRLDEIPQLFDVVRGKMSLVGPRPEVPEFVSAYLPEHYATLLVPAGITCRASLFFKDENKILSNYDDITQAYIEFLLPKKLAMSLDDLKCFSLRQEIITLLQTGRKVFS